MERKTWVCLAASVLVGCAGAEGAGGPGRVTFGTSPGHADPQPSGESSGSGAPDEQPPPPACEPGEFTCADGSCIAGTRTCNGVDDCGDGSDEDPATAGCGPAACDPVGQFTCADGSCIAAERECDGASDCPGGFDEAPVNAACDPGSPCGAGQLECPSDGFCIPLAQFCDGINHCSDGVDEDPTLCPPPMDPGGMPAMPDPSNMCLPGLTFDCGNGECIPAWWECDAVSDCSNAADELFCGGGCPTGCPCPVGLLALRQRLRVRPRSVPVRLHLRLLGRLGRILLVRPRGCPLALELAARRRHRDVLGVVGHGAEHVVAAVAW